MIIAAIYFHWISPTKLKPNILQGKDLTSGVLKLSMVSKVGFRSMANLFGFRPMANLQFGTSKKMFGVLEMSIICLRLFAG